MTPGLQAYFLAGSFYFARQRRNINLFFLFTFLLLNIMIFLQDNGCLKPARAKVKKRRKQNRKAH